jgi:hypothetical protein
MQEAPGIRNTGLKFLPATLNRLEPFRTLGTLMIKQADKARSYSPDRRSRPPDPLRRSTRPARISPSGRVSFWAIPRRGAGQGSPRRSELRRLFLSPRLETNYHSLVIRVCRLGTTHCLPVVASACHRRRATIRSPQATPHGFPYVGTAACPCTRGGRAEVARSRRAQVRAFPRAASERALAALLR